MLAKAKAKAEALEAAAKVKAAEFDEKHKLSEKKAKVEADAKAKRTELDEKHGISEKAAAAKASADAKAKELDAKHDISGKASAAKASAAAKAKELDAKHGLSDKATAAGQQADKQGREIKYGAVAKIFYTYDLDVDGALNSAELVEFCKQGLGIEPSNEAEVAAALDAMGATTPSPPSTPEPEPEPAAEGEPESAPKPLSCPSVTFDAFLAWWRADASNDAGGPMGAKLQAAKTEKFAAELAAGTRVDQMNAKVAAASASASVTAASAGQSVSAAATSAGAAAKKGAERAKHITPADKKKLMAGAQTALTVASIVCPAARVVSMANKGLLAANVASNAGLVGGGDDASTADDGTTVSMTCQLVATADAGQPMVFTVDGYSGEYSVIVPQGVKKGETFTFDGSEPQGNYSNASTPWDGLACL